MIYNKGEFFINAWENAHDKKRLTYSAIRIKGLRKFFIKTFCEP